MIRSSDLAAIIREPLTAAEIFFVVNDFAPYFFEGPDFILLTFVDANVPNVIVTQVHKERIRTGANDQAKVSVAHDRAFKKIG